MPLPSTRVVHPRWSAHHAPITEDAMNATVRITHGMTGGGWTSGGGAVPGVPIVTYLGRARVTYEPTQARDAEAAAQEVTLRRVTVSLPREAPPQEVDARVLVVGVDDNALGWLFDHTLTVGSLGRSSYAWEQLLECVDDLSNQLGEEAP